MTRPTLRVFGMDDATCDDQYCGVQTATQASQWNVVNPQSHREGNDPAMVTVRAGDLIDVLRASLKDRLQWVEDFRDDPMTVTQDFYDLIVAFQRMRRAA